MSYRVTGWILAVGVMLASANAVRMQLRINDVQLRLFDLEDRIVQLEQCE